MSTWGFRSGTGFRSSTRRHRSGTPDRGLPREHHMSQLPTPAPGAGLPPTPDAGCQASGSISGRYAREATAVPVAGQERALDLRVDIDMRYPNSQVLGRVSGDLYQVQRVTNLVALSRNTE